MVQQISQEHEEREKARKQRELDEAPVHVNGYITADIKRKLEAKYGLPKYNALFGITTRCHLDMLVDLANEYFAAEPKPKAKK